MSEERSHGQGAAPGTAALPMREALITAALQLFLERGFEQTTVDDIVTLAGVGRRSFFRYFPSKEDVLFPDHERCLAEMTDFLSTGSHDDDPVGQVCDAARLVLRMYADSPTFSVHRYRLTKQVPGLRTHELSVVWRYERVLAGHLRERFTDRPDGTLRADVIAAAVVAAHNHALRSWLRSGGQGDVITSVDEALEFVTTSWGQGRVPTDAPPQELDDVMVVIAKRRVPMWRLVREIETTLDRD
ncbi:TetR family transcriptional regulator [Streptomyces sp. GbtcB7]|uniref:TetR family transcriptional regulator n=1 Tax=Streptomyces sp. GbtcB7 TaxID=2824752 RepID=UPI0020C69EAB|nr:TetR family transcriptional regulator [Streptomyces sp. GbtcB7]